MNFETLGSKLTRWLIIWTVLIALLCGASILTHWDAMQTWFYTLIDKLVSFGIQVLFMVVGIGMMLGWLRRI